MRFDRLWIVGVLVLLAGCVTTRTDSNPNGKSIPQTTPAERTLDAARIHTELGQSYLASGDLPTAMAKLTLALKFDPNYAPAHTVIAVVYERINDLPNAELNYRKVVALEPTKGDGNNNLALFLCSTGRYAEAEVYFTRALADPFYQTPDNALTNQGICKLRQQDVVGAEASFRKALASNPTNAETLYQLANMLYLNKDTAHAWVFFQRFEAQGHPTAAGFNLGYHIEMLLGNRDGALSYSSRLQSQFPDSEQAHTLNSIASP